MAINPEVARRIEEIEQDKIHGASWLSRQALDVMSLAIERSEAREVAQFLEEMKGVGRKLGGSRPSMASITNEVAQLVYKVAQEARIERNLAALKRFAYSTNDKLIKNSDKAFQKVTEHGAGVIEPGDKIMTGSYSSTMCQTFKLAKVNGKEFSVLVAESRLGETVYGNVTESELRSYGIEVEVFPDSDIAGRMSEVDKVFVGADSVLSRGLLVNSIPSYAISSAAMECQVPFYSLCERIKFDVRSYLGWSGGLEEGFEQVPAHLITGIITEMGIIKPNEVLDYTKQMAASVQALFES